MKTGLLLIGGVMALFGYALVYNGFANMPSGVFDQWFREKGFAAALIPTSIGVPTAGASTAAVAVKGTGNTTKKLTRKKKVR